MAKTPSERRTVNSGHRLPQDSWESFQKMAEAYGLTANQALNRLVYAALSHWSLPGFKKLTKPDSIHSYDKQRTKKSPS